MKTDRATFRALGRALAILFAFVFLLASAPLASAQDAFDPAAGLPDLYGGLAVPGVPAVEEQLAVKAKIAPAAGIACDFLLPAPSAEGIEVAAEAFLLVKTTVSPGWHIYSPTQGAGGTPTTFELKASDPTVKFGVVRLATPFEKVDFFGDSLEELVGDVDWIAAIYREFPVGASRSSLDLDALKVTGTLEGLACSEGDGGACVPQTIDFTAKYDAESDASPVLAAAQKVNCPPAQTAASAENAAPSAGETAPEAAPEGGKARDFASVNIFALILTAFLGGLILNVTPCVLPVIGLKILSFFENAGRNRAKAFMLNVWYALGVLIVFGALAFASVGLSFLFTRAIFQILMSAIVFAMAPL
ncbi:MAG: hypothetical protein HUK22_03535, partial [Thermoguttaceae bacterium]|nr:hypothetical protein [Thermoguttaceae bacterium]